MKVFKNARYYCWSNGIDNNQQLQEVRIIKIKNENLCTVEKTKGSDVGSKFTMSISKLKSNYTKLTPDGYISFDIVTVGKNLKDVMVVLSRHKDIEAKVSLPFAICRQCAVDLFAKQLNPDGVDYAGIAISKDSCPADVAFENFFACNGVDLDETVAYYIGDNIFHIVEELKNKNKFDQALVELFNSHCMYLANNNKFIADSYKKKTDINGYYKTLSDLLMWNNFDYELKRAFNIIPTTLSPDNFSDQTLSLHARDILSSMLCVQIDKSLVIPYDKDINLSEIKRQYCLITDSADTVYVVAYTISGKYRVPLENIESDENIEKLGNVLSGDSIQYAYQQVQFRKEKYR